MVVEDSGVVVDSSTEGPTVVGAGVVFGSTCSRLKPVQTAKSTKAEDINTRQSASHTSAQTESKSSDVANSTTASW